MARSRPGPSSGLWNEAVSVGRRARRRLRERRCRLATRPRLIDDRRAEVTALEGLQLLVDRQDQGLSQSVVANGYWEMWLTEAVEAALKPGMVAIDVGANVGYFSMLMADRIGAAGRVHAFEPNPSMAALLADSAARNGFHGRITVHDDPLWDVDGVEALLKVPEGEPKNAHLIIGAGDAIGYQLTTRRLDSYPALFDADVIKIDVEGAEEAIWRGMEGLFAVGRPLTIFLEYSPVRYRDPMRFLDAIMSRGFALAELSVSHGIQSTTPEQVLSGNPCEDRMLALVRGAQA